MKQVNVEITACELDECAEPLIVGLQDLQKWGMELLPSPQPDRPLVSFNKLDLSVQSTGGDRLKSTSSMPAKLWASATTIVPANRAVIVPVRFVGSTMAWGDWARELETASVKLAEQPISEVLDDPENGLGRGWL